MLISLGYSLFTLFFFFNDTATTEIYTLSLHDALPICFGLLKRASFSFRSSPTIFSVRWVTSSMALWVKRVFPAKRSEEHTSELQSPDHLVCRLLLEKKKKGQRKSTLLSCSATIYSTRS